MANPSLVLRTSMALTSTSTKMVDKAKNEIVTINGDSYYFDKDNGRRVTGRQVS